MTVPGAPLLLAMGRAELESMSRMMPRGGLATCTRSIQGPDRSVSAARFASLPATGLEAAHLAGRGRAPCAASPPTMPRIAGSREPLGVVDVLVAGEPTEDRLAQQPGQGMAPVPAAPRIGEHRTRHRGQAERVVQLAIGEQPGIGGDRGAVELELQAAVEIEPDGIQFQFTRWVRHRRLPQSQDKLLIAISKSRRPLRKSARHPGNAGYLRVQHTNPKSDRWIGMICRVQRIDFVVRRHRPAGTPTTKLIGPAGTAMSPP